MKMKTEDILKKVKELDYYYEIRDFILSLDLTANQFEVLSENAKGAVKWIIAKHPDLPNDLKYKFAEDDDGDIKWKIAEHPDLPDDLIYKLAEDDYIWVRGAIGSRSDLHKDLIIRFSCDSDWDISTAGFIKLKKLNNLKSEDLEKAYDLIRTSKLIGRENFEEIFDHIVSNFPELSEAAKLFKSIILKGKRDMK